MSIEMEYLPADNDFIRKKIKANFVLLGKRLGGKMKLAAAAIAAIVSGRNQAIGINRDI